MLKLIKSNEGLTLVEVLAVVTILGIIAAIAVPSVSGLIEKSREDVCEVNLHEVGRMYRMNLELENVNHSEQLFTSYLKEYGQVICPVNGTFNYVDGKVHCSIHSNQEESNEEDNNIVEVPFF